jgi:transposase-like protein
LTKSKKRWRWNAGEEGTPMLRVHVDEAAGAEQSTTLDELVAEGARRMLAAALEAEVDAYVTALSDERDEAGHRLVVRNGHAVARSLVTGAGPIEVRAPRVDDRRVDEATGEKMRFRSSILPPWARKSPKVAEVLPLMYLHGMSSGDFVPALEEFFGSAAGLSASVVTRLTTEWQKERDQFAHRSLKDVDYVYVYADGIHFNVRLEEARLCALVIVGVRSDGTKELVSISDGHRESTESWADVLRGLKRRGMTAPVLAVGDGALGFWGALSDVFPETVHQRCWVHKMANCMNALPKSAQPAARAALKEVRDAEDKEHAEKALASFVKDLRGQMAQGHREDREGPRGAARLLRLPCRTLGPPEDHEPDRVDVRNRAIADQGDQGPGLTSGRPRHGLQADRVGPDPVANGQRTPPRRPDSCRCELRKGGDGRKN